MVLAQERKEAGRERVGASRAVDESREAQRLLAEAVRAWVGQGVPIPFASELSGT